MKEKRIFKLGDIFKFKLFNTHGIIHKVTDTEITVFWQDNPKECIYKIQCGNDGNQYVDISGFPKPSIRFAS
jgi:hypothetical protein